MTEFKSDGYVVFFGVIEIYSREFSKENGWKLIVSLSFLHQKLRVSSSKVKKILSKIHKWEIVFEGNQVTIFIPKFTELLDEWTARKIGSKSGVTPKILKHNTDKELELDKDIYKGKVVSVVEKEKAIKKETIYPDWLSMESLVAFIEHRKKIRKPLTDKALEMTITKLSGFRDDGYDPNLLINEAIMRGWQSVFLPEKDQEKFKLKQAEHKQKTLEEVMS